MNVMYYLIFVSVKFLVCFFCCLNFRYVVGYTLLTLFHGVFIPDRSTQVVPWEAVKTEDKRGDPSLGIYGWEQVDDNIRNIASVLV